MGAWGISRPGRRVVICTYVLLLFLREKSYCLSSYSSSWDPCLHYSSELHLVQMQKYYQRPPCLCPFPALLQPTDHLRTQHSPASPAHMDWSAHFPFFVSPEQTSNPGEPPRMSQPVEMADVGCGFGGLLVALSPVFPNTLMIGTYISSLPTTPTISLPPRPAEDQV